jgi:hypothetical protein
MLMAMLQLITYAHQNTRFDISARRSFFSVQALFPMEINPDC